MGNPSKGRGVNASLDTARPQTFPPYGTVKCDGPKLFRSQVARDVACLLDLEPDVLAWVCMPSGFVFNDFGHTPDFEVLFRTGETSYFDAPDRTLEESVAAIEAAYALQGAVYRVFDADQLNFGYRLRNAKDLLRYAGHLPTLGDRIRLLATLEEEGSLTLAQCLTVFREGNPIAGVSSLILSGIIAVELDETLIGPETSIQRIRL